MDEKSGRVVPKTKTSKNAFSPVGEEEYRNLISKLTFYDFDALDILLCSKAMCKSGITESFAVQQSSYRTI